MAFLTVSQPVYHGVFHNWLNDQFRNHTVCKLLRKLVIETEFPLKTDLLYLRVAVYKLQLLLQGDKLGVGYAGPQNLRQLCRQGGDLRDVVRLGDPFHRIQCIVQEMGIQLGLHHCVQLLLLADLHFHIGLQLRRHGVEAAGQLAKLIIPRGNDPRVEISVLHLVHGLIQALDRTRQMVAHLRCHRHTKHQTGGRHDDQHAVHGFRRVSRKYLRPQKDAVESRPADLRNIDAVIMKWLINCRARHQSVPQNRPDLLTDRGSRTVDRFPEAV